MTRERRSCLIVGFNFPDFGRETINMTLPTTNTFSNFSAFFPLLVILHFVQLFFYHILISQDWFVATLFGNSLWLIALMYYVYINFLGYNSLGILQNTRAFLYPLAPIVLFILGTLIANWNLSKSLIHFYHYRVL